MNISRRHFLNLGLSGSLAGIQAHAQSAPGYRALVCVFLFGGHDANNAVIPMDAARLAAYTDLRKNLALAANTLLPVQTATSRQPLGLHPRLVEMQKLFNSRQLALVANVGVLAEPLTRAQYLANGLKPSNLFSHSDQVVQWQTSIPNSFGTSGWGGRAADQVLALNPSGFPTAISVAGNSLFATGQVSRPATVTPNAALGLRGFTATAASQARYNALKEILTFDTGVKLVAQASRILSQGLSDSDALNRALASQPALATAFPANNSLATQLQQVARLIQARQALGMNRQIFFCSLGGFDTHSDQLNDQGNLLGQVDAALGAFFQATVELGVAGQVTAFTESDFGRTYKPNSNGGSDHAWGATHLVLGGAVKGGELYGALPDPVLGSGQDAGSEGRWIPSIAIDQYGATLASWFGVPPQSLASVFPNLARFGTANLGFLG